jgi:hypothetical protein
LTLAKAQRDPPKYNGARLTAATTFYTAQEQVDIWSVVSGKKVVLPTISDIPTLTNDPIKQMFAQRSLGRRHLAVPYA